MAKQRTEVLAENLTSGPGWADIKEAVKAMSAGKGPPVFDVRGSRHFQVGPESITVRKTPAGALVDIEGIGNLVRQSPGPGVILGARVRILDYCPRKRRAPKIERIF